MPSPARVTLPFTVLLTGAISLRPGETPDEGTARIEADLTRVMDRYCRRFGPCPNRGPMVESITLLDPEE